MTCFPLPMYKPSWAFTFQHKSCSFSFMEKIGSIHEHLLYNFTIFMFVYRGKTCWFCSFYLLSNFFMTLSRFCLLSYIWYMGMVLAWWVVTSFSYKLRGLVSSLQRATRFPTENMHPDLALFPILFVACF